MKIATWNVNGIRARAAQLREWMERDRPDVVCLQELKAERAQIPAQCELAGYHAYFHGLRAYSGVSLHIRRGLFDSEPEFDMESRIVQASFGRLVLASKSIAARATECVVLREVGTSGHAPVVMTAA